MEGSRSEQATMAALFVGAMSCTATEARRPPDSADLRGDAGGDAGGDGGTDAVAHCPSDLAGWNTYRDSLAKALSENLGVDSAGNAYAFMQRCLAQVPDADVTRARGCVARVLEFVSGEAAGPGKNTLGFTISDADYNAQTRPLAQLPAEFAASAFTSLLSSWDRTSAIAAYIEGLNARRLTQGIPRVEWLTYQTLLETPDSAQTSGRLLVVYPDPGLHRTVWTQFGLTQPGTSVQSSHVFSITIVDTPAGARQIYFHRFQKETSRDGSLAIVESTDATPLDRCESCHKSGPLVVDASQVDLPFQATVERLREVVLGYGVVSSPFSEIPHRGPGLGTPGRRTREFIERCAAPALDEASVDKKEEVLATLTGAMNCASCHDGTYRGRLNTTLNPVILDKYYWSGLMPPGYETRLTQLERASLMTCLATEYFGESPDFDGVLSAYLREPPCQ